MNREIKFRAWDKENGYYADYEDIEEEITAQAIDGWRSEDGGTSFTLDYGIKDFELEQYTGLKDKNGIEIYEGDIVRIMGYGTYEVFWRSWDSSFSLKAIDTDIEEHKILMLCEDWEGDYTIIGNIHENPELLEVNNGQ